MAARNILHKSELEDFESFVEEKGYVVIETSGNPQEVFRAKKGKNTVAVYMKAGSFEQIEIRDMDFPLVREFMRRQNKTTNADRIRSMTDEELAEFLCVYDACAMCEHNYDDFCCTKNCNEVCITKKWLQSPAGEGDEK